MHRENPQQPSNKASKRGRDRQTNETGRHRDRDTNTQTQRDTREAECKDRGHPKRRGDRETETGRAPGPQGGAELSPGPGVLGGDPTSTGEALTTGDPLVPLWGRQSPGTSRVGAPWAAWGARPVVSPSLHRLGLGQEPPELRAVGQAEPRPAGEGSLLPLAGPQDPQHGGSPPAPGSAGLGRLGTPVSPRGTQLGLTPRQGGEGSQGPGTHAPGYCVAPRLRPGPGLGPPTPAPQPVRGSRETLQG